MNTLNINRKYLIALMLAAAVASTASVQEPKPKAPVDTEPVPGSVNTFNDKMPIGYLGKPLGTVVRVTGVCIDGTTLKYKHLEGKLVLRVETVDGKKLKEPVDFVDFSYWRSAKVDRRPDPKQTFDYYVYEFGSFGGQVKIPDHVADPIRDSGNVVGIAAPGFHYSSSISVLQSMPVKK